MNYLKRKIKEINVCFSCPECNYETISKHYFIKHLNNCLREDIEDYYMDENFTLEDYIEQQTNLIDIIKEFIRPTNISNWHFYKFRPIWHIM